MTQRQPHEVCKLGDEACALLTAVIQRCHDWQCVLAALQEAGLDITQQSGEMEAQSRLAAGLKAKFFPNNP